MFGQKHFDEPSGPSGRRAYAVGDVHGRLDLLEQLLEKIHADRVDGRPSETLLIFLGDLIDRGPSSKQVVERLRTYRHEGVRTLFLLGNHEEVLLRILEGEADLIAKWRLFGGTQTLESYSVDVSGLLGLPDEAAIALIRKAIPDEHVEFLRTFVDTCRFGDYLFVHAGIRPRVPLNEQRQSDLRWIREPFLTDDTPHGFVVVHGHSIANQVEERPNRIGIDTGAFATGVLTALAIEGSRRWYVDTRATVGTAVSAAH